MLLNKQVAASESIYAREPLGWRDGIPQFTQTDAYTDNYLKISQDHLASMKPDAANPFIPDDLWLAVEAPTRALVKKYTQPGQKILDVGVGLARILGGCPEFDRYGIDISMEYLKLVREKGIAVAFSKIEDMPYRDNMFDTVMATDVLEHVFDLNACTQQILRVIKPGGHLVIRVPYKEDLSAYLQEGLPYEFVHLRNFDMESVRLHFEKIFHCKVVEMMTAVPYLQGAARFKVRLYKRSDPIRNFLKKEGRALKKADSQGYKLIEALAAVSEEEMVDWIYKVQEKKPELFKLLQPYLLMDIEIHAVIQKPLGA